MNSPDKSSSENVQKHVPSGYCLVAIEQETGKLLMFKLKGSEGCMIEFVRTIEVLAYDIYNKKQQFRKLTSSIWKKDNKKPVARWVCEENFDEADVKVVDHCHYSGKFIGFAHSQCNIQRRSLNFTPIVAHNLSHYELHLLYIALHSCSPESLIKIILQTDEKYV